MTTRLEQYQTRAAKQSLLGARRPSGLRRYMLAARARMRNLACRTLLLSLEHAACAVQSAPRCCAVCVTAGCRSSSRWVPLRCCGSGPVQLLTPSVLAGVSGQTEQLGSVHRCGYGRAPHGLRCAVRRVTSAWERSAAACSAGLCSPGVPQRLPQRGPVCTLGSSDPLELWGKQMGPGAEFWHSIHGRRSAGCSKHA
ncbi:uncharacterized protein ACIBXB_004063 isoform 1-T1 [Morphnus guianensis]